MTRIWLAAGAIIGLVALAPQTAQARVAPWCGKGQANERPQQSDWIIAKSHVAALFSQKLHKQIIIKLLEFSYHFVALRGGAKHFEGYAYILREYAAHYNGLRTHRVLNQDAPVRRVVQAVGAITSRPVLGGPHH